MSDDDLSEEELSGLLGSCAKAEVCEDCDRHDPLCAVTLAATSGAGISPGLCSCGFDAMISARAAAVVRPPTEPDDELQRLRDDMADALGINEQVIAEYDALRTAIEFAGWCPVRQGDGSFRLEAFDGG